MSVCSAIETCKDIEILHVANGAIEFFKKGMTKGLLISLCESAGWSAPVLLAYNNIGFSHNSVYIILSRVGCFQKQFIRSRGYKKKKN